ncbi:MAG: hypothetical protein DRI88_11130 [Bacteroidetes bacterium]|nr:MAG: hypothetical protein DRI88_11130 [Bacteroidota bacterium]
MLSYGLIEPDFSGDDTFFQEYLNELIAEIFDASVHFEQTEDDRMCSYCDFRYICNK